MNAIEVTRPNISGGSRESALSREVWRFIYFEDRHVLALDSYERQARETSRHKFRVVAAYKRLRHERTSDYDRLVEADVPIPDDVSREAHSQFAGRLRVVRWSTVSDR